MSVTTQVEQDLIERDPHGVPIDPEPRAWWDSAPKLTTWVMDRLVNRIDAWGGYRAIDEIGKKYKNGEGEYGEQTTRKGTLSAPKLMSHFRYRRRPNLVGLHTTSPDNLSKWGALDVDNHGDGEDTPEGNLQFVMDCYKACRDAGWNPLLTDSNGKGGYHLRLLLESPAPTANFFFYLKEVVAGWQKYNLASEPETFPKQEGVDESRRYGNWLRTFGHHHKRNHWSRVWDGEKWLSGKEAIDFILAMKGDPVHLLPEAPPPPPPAPVVTRPPLTYHDENKLVRRCVNYLNKCAPSIMQQRGSDKLYWAARVVVYGFDFGAERGSEIIKAHFNHVCVPPWTDAEIMHKCQNADTKPFRQPRGFLRDKAMTKTKRPPTSQEIEAEKYILPKKKLTDARKEKLRRLLNSCAISAGEQQSKAKWALACRCIEEGYSQVDIWALVKEMSGFEEKDFADLWERATKHVKLKLYTLATQAEKAAQEAEVQPLAADGGSSAPPTEKPSTEGPSSNVFVCFKNWEEGEDNSGERSIKYVFGYPVQAIVSNLFHYTCNWPRRVGENLFVPGTDGKPLWLKDSTALFAWIEGQIVPSGKQAGLSWDNSTKNCVTQSRFFAYLQQHAEAYEGVQLYPHYPPVPGIYYCHPDLPTEKDGRPLDGRHLGTLVGRFNPETTIDRDLILAAIVTQFWGGPLGRRPVFNITTNEEGDRLKGRGAGKTTVATLITKIAGGAISIGPTEQIATLKTRMLTPTARTLRNILIDNIKSNRFSWGEFEDLVTCSTISGRQNYVGEGRIPNLYTSFLTVNGVSFSRDVAQRTVTIKVKRPDHYDPKWEHDTEKHIEENRWEIIADCISFLKENDVALAEYTRWARWDEGVLSHLPEPNDAVKVIKERQLESDDEAAEEEITAQAIREELTKRGHDLAKEAVWISSVQMSKLLNEIKASKLDAWHASRALGRLNIPQLKQKPRNIAKGWEWRELDRPGVAVVDLLPSLREQIERETLNGKRRWKEPYSV